MAGVPAAAGLVLLPALAVAHDHHGKGHDHGHHWHDDDGFSVGGRPGRDWYKLAEAHAGKLIDRDEIDVRTDRAFTAIRLRVFEAPVEINSVRVYFRNGENRNLPVRQHIERGGSTRVIDLPGERRIISKVVCWYNTPASARRDARVEIWGHR
ncbi:MAG: hypothetical protein KGQ67_05815 [Betaproteobacteria bacterium]|nr:hypothetical protein [Betaproteobacteria bacterium]